MMVLLASAFNPKIFINLPSNKNIILIYLKKNILKNNLYHTHKQALHR